MEKDKHVHGAYALFGMQAMLSWCVEDQENDSDWDTDEAMNDEDTIYMRSSRQMVIALRVIGVTSVSNECR